MKRLSNYLLGFLMLFLIGCSGSDVYLGAWKAKDVTGARFDINFEANSLTIKDSAGVITKYEYTQNSIEINTSAKTYGINLKDGRAYQLYFLQSAHEKTGYIKDDNGNLVYTLSR
ncbi:MAG: hypothetical protein IT236_03250 [Bacteroidia bacterium]|nr:hypothetical protein [Bacteroidia bacterium]